MGWGGWGGVGWVGWVRWGGGEWGVSADPVCGFYLC